ncbi:MAG: 1-deoxy-D-xylulose-5-phosphate reductoisomerase [Candidatus Howiella sp.]
MTKTLSLLGSTGSIGRQALEVARTRGIRVSALAAGRNIDLLETQIREFHPAVAAVFDREAASRLAVAVADTSTRVIGGEEGVLAAAQEPSADTVLNAVVGIAGLRATLATIEAGKTLALANKESLVTGGELVMRRARENGVRILPVDSEHSAIFQCLQGAPPDGRPAKLLLTASGGPFFGKTREALQNVTPAEALRHPNWSMGAKITIDSATLMNKGLEVIEAVHLFGLPPEKIEIIVHQESIIHSAVEYDDGAVIAQLGIPDMKLPISYALTWPERYPADERRLSLTALGRLTFFSPDMETFACLPACLRAIERGGLVPAAANGANEAAVARFLAGEIGFLEIGELVAGAAERQREAPVSSVEAVFEADRAAREFVATAPSRR